MLKDERTMTDESEIFDRLDFVYKSVVEWLKFAEQKITGLLLLNSAVIWGYARLLGEQTSDVGLYSKLNIIGFIGLIISALICIIALMPVLNTFWYYKTDKKVSDNMFFFGDIQKYHCPEFLNKLLDTGNDPKNNKQRYSRSITDLADQIIINSKITTIKYSRFKLATIFSLLAFLLLVISQVLYQLGQ
jgi:hypothetical protein